MKTAVTQGDLAKRVASARNRLENFYQRVAERTSLAAQELVPEALQTLSNALEELSVATEELRCQNDELVATRDLLEAQRTHYRELFEFAPDCYLVTDTQGTILEANHRAAELLHAGRELLVGTPVLVFASEQGRRAFRKLLIRSQQEEKLHICESEIHPHGRPPFPAALTVVSIRESSSRALRPVGLHWLIRDITERVQVEKTLRETDERFRLLIEGVSDYAIFMVDPEGFVASWNSGAERINGYREEEIIGKHFSRFYPAEEVERGKPQQNLTVAAAEGRLEDEGWRVRKDGSRFWASVVITAVRDDFGKLRGFSQVTRDVTERKRAEEQVRESEARLKAITDNCPAMIFLKDPQGRYLYTNPVFEKLIRRPGTEVIGKTDVDLFPPEQAAAFRANDLKVLEARFPVEFEEVALHDDGLHTSVVCKFPLFDAAGNLYALCGIVTDITERKKAEQRLHTQLTAVRALAESATLSEAMPRILKAVCETLGSDWGELWVVDHHATDLRCAEFYHVPSAEFPEFEAQTRQIRFPQGLALPGRVWSSGEPIWIANCDVLDASQVPRLEAARREGLQTAVAIPVMVRSEIAGVMAFFSRHIRGLDGQLLEMLSTLGSQIGLFIERQRAEAALRQAHDELESRVRERTEELSNINEVLRAEVAKRQRTAAQLRASEQQLRRLTKELEEQLIESDRLISVGELATSVAHEFNNPLQIILGYTQELLSEIELSRPQHEYLKIVEKETHRCGKLIRNLMDFARPAHGDLRPSDVAPIIRSGIRITQGYLNKSRIKVMVDIQPNLPQIDADPNQLQQVLLNFFFNAAEAMPKGGSLTIRAVTNPATSTSGRKNNREERLELTLAVSDTGVGIGPASLPQIFRPFFTTKQKRGMGLGLFICERIMRAHGGRISVDSTPGKGTTFYLHFPLAETSGDGSGS